MSPPKNHGGGKIKRQFATILSVNKTMDYFLTGAFYAPVFTGRKAQKAVGGLLSYEV